MTQKPDGGPAYPIETTATPYAQGMTLRDYFAGQALADGFAFGVEAEDGPHDIARACYTMADAMIAARDAK